MRSWLPLLSTYSALSYFGGHKSPIIFLGIKAPWGLQGKEEPYLSGPSSEPKLHSKSPPLPTQEGLVFLRSHEENGTTLDPSRHSQIEAGLLSLHKLYLLSEDRAE